MPRKRAWHEMNGQEPESGPSTPAPVSEQLLKIRNMWEFASLMQYIFFFGKVVKIDQDIDIELEMECLNPVHSTKLSEIGLALLKFVSSHRGLTPDLFDEYSRRQYLAKAPQRNPFGDEEEPSRFSDFDIFTKIRILHQLSTWTLHNPDRIRERMDETDAEQTNWRIEPLGWDSQHRSYFVLDDDRFYRMTDASPPPANILAKPRPKAKRPRTKPSRVSARRRVSIIVEDTSDEEDETEVHQGSTESENNGLGGAKWECVAVTLEEYNAFLESISKTRNSDEKILKKRLVETVLPIIQKNAEGQERKIARKQKELENLQKLATAKRSGRIAGRLERQREIEEAAEAERKRKEDLAMALKEQEKQRKMEAARESRMQTREQRLKDREVKRILHEEELAKLERSQSADTGDGRFSERHLKAEKEKRQKELEKLSEEESDWYFDCAVCGIHGRNLDDGTHIMQCEKCNVWQHCACHNITADAAAKDDFHFVCKGCLKPKPIKLRLTSSISPSTERNGYSTAAKSPKAEAQANGVMHQSKPNPQPRAKQILWVPARRPATANESPTSPVRQAYLAHQPYITNGLHNAIQPFPETVQAHSSIEGPNIIPGNPYTQYRDSRSSPPLVPNQLPRPNGDYQYTTSQSQVYHNTQMPNLTRLPPMQGANTYYDHTRHPPYYSPNSRMLPSPTEGRPSLAATQGNTDIRFSPHGNHSTIPYPPVHSAFAPSASSYAPAYSPSKHQSPPTQSQTSLSRSPPQQLPPQATLPSPSAAASAPVAGIGLSPIKHSSPRPPPSSDSPIPQSLAFSPASLHMPPLKESYSPPSTTTLPPIKYAVSPPPAPALTVHQSNSSILPNSSSDASSSAKTIPISHSAPTTTLPPAPALSPSQGLWQGPVEAPVKKPTMAEISAVPAAPAPAPAMAVAATQPTNPPAPVAAIEIASVQTPYANGITATGHAAEARSGQRTAE